MVDELRDSANRTRDYRKSTCQTFQDHQAGGFGPYRRTDKAVGSLHIARYIHLTTEETDPGLQTQCLAQVCEAARIGAIPYDPRNDSQGKSPEGPQDDVNPLPLDQVSDHEDYKLICDIELLPEMGSPGVIGSKTLGVDEMGTRTEVWPYAFSFETSTDEITDAEDSTVPPEQDSFDGPSWPRRWKDQRQFPRHMVG